MLNRPWWRRDYIGLHLGHWFALSVRHVDYGRLWGFSLQVGKWSFRKLIKV